MPGTTSEIHYLERHLKSLYKDMALEGLPDPVTMLELQRRVKPHLQPIHVNYWADPTVPPKNHRLYKWIHNVIRRSKWGSSSSCNRAVVQTKEKDAADQKYEEIFQYLDKHPDALTWYLKGRPNICLQLGIRRCNIEDYHVRSENGGKVHDVSGDESGDSEEY